MTMWDTLFIPLIFIAGGLALAFAIHGMPSLITIHKHFDNKNDDEK